jgi:hypothetical protein
VNSRGIDVERVRRSSTGACLPSLARARDIRRVTVIIATIPHSHARILTSARLCEQSSPLVGVFCLGSGSKNYLCLVVTECVSLLEPQRFKQKSRDNGIKRRGTFKTSHISGKDSHFAMCSAILKQAPQYHLSPSHGEIGLSNL